MPFSFSNEKDKWRNLWLIDVLNVKSLSVHKCPCCQEGLSTDTDLHIEKSRQLAGLKTYLFNINTSQMTEMNNDKTTGFF